MQSRTKLSKKDIKDILSNYEFDTFLKSKVFVRGSVQTNLLVTTTKGKYVLRCYKGRTPESVKFENDLINYLRKHDFPTPRVIPNNLNKFFTSQNGGLFAVFEYVEGQHIKKPSTEQKNQLIQKVAELQNILKGYNPKEIKYRWNYSSELCWKLAEQAAKKLENIDARKKLKWLKNELSKLKLPTSLPKGICHCDFHFANILFKNEKFNTLLDFDDANYTYKTYDLICLIEPFKFSWNNWSKFTKTVNVFDFTESKAVVAEYEKTRPLTKVEKLHLYDVYKLSILIDCVWYFSRGDAEDFYEKRKIEYLNNLGRVEFYRKIFNGI